MTTLQFPSNPEIGDEYDYPPYKYYWDGQKWKTKGIGYNPVNDLRNEVLPTTREAIRRSYAEAGFTLVDGSFEEGGTLTSASDVLLHKASGIAYSGPIGQVAADTDPTASGGGYVARSDALLRGELADWSGSALVGFKNKFLSQSIALSIHDKVAEIKSILDFGVDVADPAGDTAAFQLAANSGMPIYIPHIGRDYVVSHVDLPNGTEWYGDGKARVVQSASDIVDQPGEGQQSGTGLFRSVYGNHKFRGFTIVPQSEAIAVEPATNDSGILTLESMKIDGLLNTAALLNGAPGVFARNIYKLALVNTYITGVGVPGSWSGTACLTGNGDGVLTRDIEFLTIDGSCHIEFAGRNGVAAYSTRNVSIAPGCVINNCYQSAVQGYASLGSSYTGRFSWGIDGLITYHNCADSIDMNWIFSGQPDFDMRVSNCKHFRNGWFQGDTTKGGNDGSGIGTYRSIANLVLQGNIDIDCRGSGEYITNATNVTSMGNLSVKLTTSTKEGLYLGGGVTRFKSIGDTFITNSANALSFGGSQTLTDVKFIGSTFTSSAGYAMVQGSGSTVDGLRFTDVTFNTAQLMYILYGRYSDVTFNSSSTSGAISLSNGGIQFDGLYGKCAGGWFLQAQNTAKIKISRIDIDLSSVANASGVLLNGADNCYINGSIKTVSGECVRLYSNGSNYCDNTDLSYLTLERTDAGVALLTNYANNTYKNRVQLVAGTASHTGGTTLTATYA